MQITSILIATDWSFPTSAWVVQVMVANSSYALPAATFTCLSTICPRPARKKCGGELTTATTQTSHLTAGGEQLKSADDKSAGFGSKV